MDLFLSVEPRASDLEALFEVAWPVQLVADWSDDRARQLSQCHVVLASRNGSEFPFGLSFQHQGDDQEGWLQRSAGELSLKLKCRSLYTGNPIEPDNPFLCILFDNGLAYLADDEGSLLAEGEGGPVKIVRRVRELDVHST